MEVSMFQTVQHGPAGCKKNEEFDMIQASRT
jgi:hypothetical protein